MTLELMLSYLHALEYEAAYNLSRRSTQRMRTVSAEEAQTENGNLLKQMQATLEEKRQELNRPAKRPKCFNCGKRGHLRRDCRQRARCEERQKSQKIVSGSTISRYQKN